MRKKKRAACTEMTDGVVVKFQNKGMGQDGVMAPRVITVRYTVDSVDYEIKETVKMKSRTIKIGPIPIGQHKRPVMPEI